MECANATKPTSEVTVTRAGVAGLMGEEWARGFRATRRASRNQSTAQTLQELRNSIRSRKAVARGPVFAGGEAGRRAAAADPPETRTVPSRGRPITARRRRLPVSQAGRRRFDVAERPKLGKVRPLHLQLPLGSSLQARSEAEPPPDSTRTHRSARSPEGFGRRSAGKSRPPSFPSPTTPRTHKNTVKDSKQVTTCHKQKGSLSQHQQN